MVRAPVPVLARTAPPLPAMDDFEQNQVLARMGAMPHDPLGASCPVLPSAPICTSLLRGYLQTVVEALPELDAMTEGLEDLMEALRALEVPSPVVAQDLEDALATLPKETQKRYRAMPDFFPRALKTLNGPDFCLVAHEEVVEAVHREEAMRGMPHGWGVSDPPMHAVAHRLLGSVGVDARHLPKYKTLPPTTRGRLMAAWNGACKTLGWAAFNPEGDLKADARLRTARDAALMAVPKPYRRHGHGHGHGHDEDLDPED